MWSRLVALAMGNDGAVADYCGATRETHALHPPAGDEATAHVYKNFTDIAEIVDTEELDVQIARPEDVWLHVQPTIVYVSRRHRRDKKVYVQVSAECAWEPEHGLQIVYREGKDLCRVSGEDGHLTHTDAYALPEEEDRIS